MALDSGGDLEVDVLIVGAGIQGLYLASALKPQYRVCVVSDPNQPPETLDSSGLISAGYDGTDPNRIQPARRAAGFWRMWAEMNGVPRADEPTLYVVPESEALSRPRLWDDAMLTYRNAGEIGQSSFGQLFDGGVLSKCDAYTLDNDVVINPAVLLEQLRSELGDCWLDGRVVRCGMVADEYVDYVEVEVGETTVVVAPRSIVLAAGVGNAELLGMVAKRFDDAGRRRDAQELARTSQAVQLATVVCIRGRELPLLSGWFGDLSIVSHRIVDDLDSGDENDVVWLVSLPPRDVDTRLGPQDLRFDPPTHPDAVRDVLDRLFAVAPGLGALRQSVQWATYCTRRTQHPSLAVTDSTAVARPVPAKLETLGLDSLFALWPSHLGYSMVLGDVVAERIAGFLGDPGDFSDSVSLSELVTSPSSMKVRWERDGVAWSDWETFSERVSAQSL